MTKNSKIINIKNCYWLCQKCGDKLYPHVDKKKMAGMTVMKGGRCEFCQKKLKNNEYLIPQIDFKNPNWD